MSENKSKDMLSKDMENKKQFVLELMELSRKYQIKIGGCGCCGSPFLSKMDPMENLPDAGYYIDDDGDSLKWVSRYNEDYWERLGNYIVSKKHRTIQLG